MAAPTEELVGAEVVCRNYLILFAHEHVKFQIPEIKSVAELFGIKISWNEKHYHEKTLQASFEFLISDNENYNYAVYNNSNKQPFLIVGVEKEEHVRKLASRCVLIRSVYELWAHGKSYKDLCENLHKTPKELMIPHFGPEVTFKFEIEAFNKKLSLDYQHSRYESLPEDILQFQGKIKLKNPDQKFTICEHYGPFGTQPTEQPCDVYFGRWIADGQRDLIRKHSLQNRLFIGNTSMDAGLSLLMANIAKVKRNSLVFDPFVGTGSLLVACAQFEAYVMGTDIDYLLLHAKGRPSRAKQKRRHPDESIRANLQQYGLEQFYIEALVADSSRHEMWRNQPMFDAIVTDPPYGIREKTEKVGCDVENLQLSEKHKIGHIPQKVNYDLGQIFKDLLNFAARFLHVHGRLTYWLPVYSPDYQEENIPQHPCLRLVYNCEQILNTTVSRRLITMEKVKDFEESKVDQAEAHIELNHYHDASFREKYFQTKKPRSNASLEGQNKTNTSHSDSTLDNEPANPGLEIGMEIQTQKIDEQENTVNTSSKINADVKCHNCEIVSDSSVQGQNVTKGQGDFGDLSNSLTTPEEAVQKSLESSSLSDHG